MIWCLILTKYFLNITPRNKFCSCNNCTTLSGDNFKQRSAAMKQVIHQHLGNTCCKATPCSLSTAVPMQKYEDFLLLKRDNYETVPCDRKLVLSVHQVFTDSFFTTAIFVKPCNSFLFATSHGCSCCKKLQLEHVQFQHIMKLRSFDVLCAARFTISRILLTTLADCLPAYRYPLKIERLENL